MMMTALRDKHRFRCGIVLQITALSWAALRYRFLQCMTKLPNAMHRCCNATLALEVLFNASL